MNKAVLLRSSLVLLMASGSWFASFLVDKIFAYEDHGVQIDADAKFDNGVRFLVSTPRALEATVTFDCDRLVNMKPSKRLPYSFQLKSPCSQREFLRFTQIGEGKWEYGKWKAHHLYGVFSKAKTIDYHYVLPYRRGEQHEVCQTWMGSFSHQEGSDEEYAVDFAMPVGTPVCAARPGVVIAYRDDSTTGGPSEKFLESANYVIIKHGDGTYASYAHLMPKGVKAALGQQVNEGEVIGYSGATGFTAAPHLHFRVFRINAKNQSRSLPFAMKTPEGLLRKPELNVAY